MAMCRTGDVVVSDKQNKFKPSQGFVIAVIQNAQAIRLLAEALESFPETVGEALEKIGFQLVADPFDLSADATKLIVAQEKQATQGLRVVKKEENDGETTPSESI
jgi:hypothetical protein